MLVVGLERLEAQPGLAEEWGRCGLLSNQASVTRTFVPAWKVCNKVLGRRLVAMFGPQHGFYGTAQDNMIETTHARHLHSGLPLYSLYSETREPTDEMLAGLDTLIIDLQITGCRIYTWKSTIAGCLRAARRNEKKVVILDRPNPVGGEMIEGRTLDDDCKSFVGQFPTPMRHGLTAAEAALYFNAEIGADLEVVPLKNWDPSSFWHQLQRPWVLTSPNLPAIDPVYVYPGMVMLEGTNLSEGRGTGLPFQFIGAPYIKSGAALIGRVRELLDETPGVYLRECCFEPTSQKWKGETCSGLQLHVIEPAKIRSYVLTLAIIRAAIELGGDKFKWKDPPYEYDYETLPMKLIIGSRDFEKHLSTGKFSPEDNFWSDGVHDYIEKVKPFLLYKRSLVNVT